MSWTAVPVNSKMLCCKQCFVSSNSIWYLKKGLDPTIKLWVYSSWTLRAATSEVTFLYSFHSFLICFCDSESRSFPRNWSVSLGWFSKELPRISDVKMQNKHNRSKKKQHMQNMNLSSMQATLVYTEAILVAQYVFQLPVRLHCGFLSPKMRDNIELLGLHSSRLRVIPIFCVYLITLMHNYNVWRQQVKPQVQTSFPLML